jgi:hypothetical protein
VLLLPNPLPAEIADSHASLFLEFLHANNRFDLNIQGPDVLAIAKDVRFQPLYVVGMLSREFRDRTGRGRLLTIRITP